MELRKVKSSIDKEKSWNLLTSKIALPISIILPAFNEEETIADSLNSVLALEFPEFEVIVVNDGSTDRTLDVLIKKFALQKAHIHYENELEHKAITQTYISKHHPNLIILDKVNGGKADAANAGINISRKPLFCLIDADCLLERDSLLKVMQPFIENPDEMIAAGGVVRIGNGCKVINGETKSENLPNKLLPLLQNIEYLRAFLMGRLSWNKLGMLTIISGAFGLFKRSAVVKVGGFSIKTIGEDFELVLKLHHYFMKNKIKYKMDFLSQPVCWTEAPERIKRSKGALATRNARRNIQTYRHAL